MPHTFVDCFPEKSLGCGSGSPRGDKEEPGSRQEVGTGFSRWITHSFNTQEAPSWGGWCHNPTPGEVTVQGGRRCPRRSHTVLPEGRSWGRILLCFQAKNTQEAEADSGRRPMGLRAGYSGDQQQVRGRFCKNDRRKFTLPAPTMAKCHHSICLETLPGGLLHSHREGIDKLSLFY